MPKFKLGILGVGKMGSSILEGIINSKLYNKDEIYLYDINDEIINKYQQRGFKFSKSEQDLLNSIDILLLSIKPQMLSTLKIKSQDINNILIISIVAGKKIEDIEAIFGKQRVIRVMPNTPALISHGTTVISKTPKTKEEDLKLVKSVFDQIGTTEIIDDSLMNEIIPLNGSMPAFVYYFIKAFLDQASKNNIDYDQAKRLIADTFIGSAKMVLSTDKSLDELIKDVCSPKGATLEGIKVLEDNKTDEIIQKTADATIKRAYELSKL